jgi:hypothetical protein
MSPNALSGGFQPTNVLLAAEGIKQNRAMNALKQRQLELQEQDYQFQMEDMQQRRMAEQQPNTGLNTTSRGGWIIGGSC